jgi:drug/metabolite transporter (DMT)-like permease
VASPADNRRGVIAMLAAMALFVGNDTFLKLASSAYPPGQIMAVRSIFASLIALALVIAMGAGRDLHKALRPIVLLRSMLEASVAFTFITAISQLPLALVSAILQSTPIVMTLIAVILGIEAVGWRRWAAICVGFAGVLLIMRPSTDGLEPAVVFALASAILVAIRDLLTQRISSDVPSAVITLTTTIAVGLAGLVITFAGGAASAFRPLVFKETLYLLAAALFVTIGNYAIIAAFRNTEVAVVGPFRYSVIIWAVAMGYIVWGDLPDVLASLGILLIVAAGIYTLHRERIRAQTITSARPGALPGEGI